MRSQHTCSTCKQPKPIAEFPRDRSSPTGFSYRCKPCARENSRKHRAKNGRYYHRNDVAKYRQDHAVSLLVTRAYSAVRKALQQGKLAKPMLCEHCLDFAPVEAAHADYTKPLAVRWLCKSCHVHWDKAQPKRPKAAAGPN